jgi:hypothetical protein
MKKHYLLPFALFFLSSFVFSAPHSSGTEITRLMRMNLYDFNADGSIYRLDGTFAQYGDEYSNDIDGEDGRKMTNPGINVCLLRNQINLVVERRHTITADDTLFFNMWGLQRKTYLMKFVGMNLEQEGLQAYLEDSYLHTSQPVNLNDTTDIKIQFNSDPASSVPNRFRLIFTLAAPIVHFTAIAGQQTLLNWSGRNIDSVRKYWIQRSFNGTDFSDIGTVTSPAFLSENFQWADPFPGSDNNYYRIKSLQNNGEISYSNIMVTKTLQLTGSVQLFPNPAKSDNMNLKMENQPKGKYQTRLFNSGGQMITQQSFDFAGGNGTQKLANNGSITPGVYYLQIISPNGETKILKILF